jgi:hypothetical protein
MLEFQHNLLDFQQGRKRDEKSRVETAQCGTRSRMWLGACD